jgi:hypothetical protein
MSYNSDFDAHLDNYGDPDPSGPVPMNEALEAAKKIGAEHGKAGASWTFDGNTTQETYRYAVKGLDDGDPAVYDQLGGNEPQFGDKYSERQLCDDIGVDYDLTDTTEVDQIADAYLDAAKDAYWAEIERVARYQVSQEEGTS